MAPFRDRTDAGERLAAELSDLLPAEPDRAGMQVLALPRGGVPVAAPVAAALAAPLSLLLVRKIGVPQHPELAMGAIAAIGDQIRVVRNEPVIAQNGITASTWQSALDAEQAELDQRMTDFGAWLPPELTNRWVILIDDGLATGQTMRAATDVARRSNAGRVIVAAPVAAAQTVVDLSGPGVEVVCPYRPDPLYAVGEAYADFHQVTDDEMLRLLRGPYLNGPDRA